MWTQNILPRFNDTDALGHINNATFLTWFEAARRPIFELFNPGLSIKDWNLILARVEVDYLGQTNYEDEVIIESYLEKIGNSSMVICHEVFQNKQKVCVGKAIMVHFDYEINKSALIPDNIRSELEKHLKI